MNCKSSAILSRCEGREAVIAGMTHDIDGLRKNLEETLNFLAQRIEESHVLKLELVSSIVDPGRDDLFGEGFDSCRRCVEEVVPTGDISGSASNISGSASNNSASASSNSGSASSSGSAKRARCVYSNAGAENMEVVHIESTDRMLS